MSGIAEYFDSLKFSPPGGQWQFIWNKDKSMPFAGGLGFEFYINFDKRKHASLVIIRENPELLNGFTIDKVGNMLGEFFQESIEDIGIDLLFFPQYREGSVLDHIPAHALAVLEKKIRPFFERTLQKSIFCMPVAGIQCLAARFTDELMWVPGDFDLHKILKDFEVPSRFLLNSTFPPLSDWDGKRYPLDKDDSWFIVKTADSSNSEALFRRMTGALSVVIDYPHSRMITGRKLIDGRIAFKPDGSCTFTTTPSTVPPVSLPLRLVGQAGELFWMLCTSKLEKRIHTSLEYLADSWGKSRVMSFINTSIAMDALFGVNGRVRQSILEGVEANSGNVDRARERYDLILKIRNGVLHGEYPTLELCPQYLNYYENFNDDPVDDQIRILNSCLITLASAD